MIISAQKCQNSTIIKEGSSSSLSSGVFLRTVPGCYFRIGLLHRVDVLREESHH